MVSQPLLHSIWDVHTVYIYLGFLHEVPQPLDAVSGIDLLHVDWSELSC